MRAETEVYQSKPPDRRMATSETLRTNRFPRQRRMRRRRVRTIQSSGESLGDASLPRNFQGSRNSPELGNRLFAFLSDPLQNHSSELILSRKRRRFQARTRRKTYAESPKIVEFGANRSGGGPEETGPIHRTMGILRRPRHAAQGIASARPWWSHAREESPGAQAPTLHLGPHGGRSSWLRSFQRR